MTRYPSIDTGDLVVTRHGTIDLAGNHSDRAAPDSLPPGCRAIHVFDSVDGTAVLRYEQWTETPGAAMPVADGTIWQAPQQFQVYRSVPRQPGDDRDPGCVVLVRFDTRDLATARGMVDSLRDRFGTALPDGAISAHQHVAVDGTEWFNYVEFTDPAAHEAVMAPQQQRRSESRRLVESTDGVTPRGFTRYELRGRIGE